MRVLVTGAFGNIGVNVIRRALAVDAQVRALDLPTKATKKRARAFSDHIECLWGDLRDGDVVTAAVAGVDAIVHNAAILPPLSERDGALAEAVNVGATASLIAASESQASPPTMILASSVSVYGPDPDRTPPVRADSPVQASDNYTTHKLRCEAMLRESALPWTIVRIGVCVDPEAVSSDVEGLRLVFDVAPGTRLEWVHPADVAHAQVAAINCAEARGKVLLLGGGESCRATYRDFLADAAAALGVAPPPDEAFGDKPYYTDWMDTTEAQGLLQFQRHDYGDYRAGLMHTLRWVRRLGWPIRPLIRRQLLSYSRPWAERKRTAGTAKAARR